MARSRFASHATLASWIRPRSQTLCGHSTCSGSPGKRVASISEIKPCVESSCSDESRVTRSLMKRATCSRVAPWGHSAAPSSAAAGDADGGGAAWPHGMSHSRAEAAAPTAAAAGAEAPLRAPVLSRLPPAPPAPPAPPPAPTAPPAPPPAPPPAALSGDGAAYGAGEALRRPPTLETVLPEGKEGGAGGVRPSERPQGPQWAGGRLVRHVAQPRAKHASAGKRWPAAAQTRPRRSTWRAHGRAAPSGAPSASLARRWQHARQRHGGQG